MRRLLQFRLSTCLLAVVCSAVGLAWWKDREDLKRELQDLRLDVETWRRVLSYVAECPGWNPRAVPQVRHPLDELTMTHLRLLGMDVIPQNATVEAIAAFLDCPDVDPRLLAVCRLGDLLTHQTAPDLLPHLSRALSDSNRRVRFLAAQALGRLDSQEVIILLEQAIASETNSSVKKEIDSILQRMPSRISAGLRDADCYERLQALRCLYEHFEAEEAAFAIPRLVEMLDDPDAEVRYLVARAIERLAPLDSAISATFHAFRQEQNDRVRHAMARTLAQLEARRE
jgi:hypothetical protein